MNSVVGLTLAVALIAGPTSAATKMHCSIRPSADTGKAALPGLAKVSQADAQRTALGAKGVQPGASVAEAELEVEHGCLVWSFDIKVAGKSGIEEVQVDAGDGHVISHKHETPKNEAAEKAKDAAAGH